MTREPTPTPPRASAPSPEAPSHRWNVEPTEHGLRICRGDHERAEPCEWEEFVPAPATPAAPADADVRVQRLVNALESARTNVCAARASQEPGYGVRDYLDDAMAAIDRALAMMGEPVPVPEPTTVPTVLRDAVGLFWTRRDGRLHYAYPVKRDGADEARPGAWQPLESEAHPVLDRADVWARLAAEFIPPADNTRNIPLEPPDASTT